METGKQSFSDFMKSSDVQFVIPVYQHNYDWKKSHCKQLLDDILKHGEPNSEKHFMGSIVYLEEGLCPKKTNYY